MLHRLTIKYERSRARIFLDDLQIQGVKEYEVKGTDIGTVELTLKIFVSNTDFRVEKSNGL